MIIHSGIALVGPEHMVLNMSEEDINDPESRELTFAANEALKLQAVTTPKVLLGHQVIRRKCFIRIVELSPLLLLSLACCFCVVHKHQSVSFLLCTVSTILTIFI